MFVYTALLLCRADADAGANSGVRADTGGLVRSNSWVRADAGGLAIAKSGIPTST